jgi:hypothetical protein
VQAGNAEDEMLDLNGPIKRESMMQNLEPGLFINMDESIVIFCRAA